MSIEVNKVNLKEVKKLASTQPNLLASGHRLCPGCAAGTIFRQVLAAAEHPLVAAVATGCFEVSTTIYPYTAWKIPYIHNAFENAAATITGVEAMYNSLKKQGKLPEKGAGQATCPQSVRPGQAHQSSGSGLLTGDRRSKPEG